MKFDQTIDLSGASPERVWAFVMDVPSMAKCIPGCDGVEDLGNNHYKAVVKIKVGPIGLSLASDISIVEKTKRIARPRSWSKRRISAWAARSKRRCR